MIISLLCMCAMYALAVRVLTTVQEGGGRNMLISYLTSLVLNFTLIAQIVYYSLESNKTKKKA